MIKKLIPNLLHKELSYQVHGASIEVRKDFGPGHKERLYQKAFEEELKRRKILFEKERAIKIYSPKDGKYIGLYRPDFIVDQKIVVEIKAERFVGRDEIKRIYDYLRNSEYELAYFINFASPKLFVKRIIYTNERKPSFKKILASISLILALFSGLLSGLRTEAAQLILTSTINKQKISIGQQFQVDLMLDTEGEEINAIEGKIIYPGELLELKEIRDGDSIINFWIERPRADRHEIVFSGIIPGGFQGMLSPGEENYQPGRIFSVVFQTKKEGEGLIEIQDPIVLLNDGKGTKTDVKIFNFQFKITHEKPLIETLIDTKDNEPPEDFKPEIAKDPSVFDGKWFLVFLTQDKGSGIDKYLIHESRRKKERIATNEWIEAESPYLLKNQELRSFIYVKAVDKAGNERIAIVEPKYPLKWYENWWIWIIIILGLMIIYLVKRILWKRVIH